MACKHPVDEARLGQPHVVVCEIQLRSNLDCLVVLVRVSAAAALACRVVFGVAMLSIAARAVTAAAVAVADVFPT